MLNKINKDEVIAKDVNIKSVYIKTYGCQMNVYDSERMVELLKPHGFNCTTSPENADLVILNTCHIREKASEKVHSELGRIALIKKDKRQKYDSERGI